MNKKIFIILVAAFVIRLIALNQSLWLDEGTTVKVIQTFSYSGIISKFSPFDFHPPLYYLFMKLWATFMGFSEPALRMPSVIFSLLIGWLIYKISQSKWPAIFFLFNPLIIYYSQEARMYMMAVFFLSASLYFLLKRKYILFDLFCILSFYTFYGSIFFIAGFFLYLIYKKNYRIFVFSLLSTLVSILVISPLLLQQFVHARQSLQIVMNWKQVLGTATLKNLLLIPIKFTSGRISFSPKIVYYALSGIWAIIVWLFVLKGAVKYKLFVFLLIPPLALGFIFSFFSPLLQYFRFLYLIIPMSLLLAIGVVNKWQRYVLLAGFLTWSFLYLLFPQFHREDWKSLAITLANRRAIYMIPSSSDALSYYVPMIGIRDLRTLDGIELEREVAIIPYTTDIYGFDYRKALGKKGFTFKESKNVRGLWYEIWERNKGYAGSFWYSLMTAMI